MLSRFQALTKKILNLSPVWPLGPGGPSDPGSPLTPEMGTRHIQRITKFKKYFTWDFAEVPLTDKVT